jgi:hypothetical protein
MERLLSEIAALLDEIAEMHAREQSSFTKALLDRCIAAEMDVQWLRAAQIERERQNVPPPVGERH